MVKGEVAHRELIGSVVGLLLFPRRAPGAERTKGQAYLPTSGRRSGPPPAPARPHRIEDLVKILGKIRSNACDE